MTTDKKPSRAPIATLPKAREHAAKLADQLGLNVHDKADLLDLTETMNRMTVAEIQAAQADIIAAPFKPGAVRGPLHAAKNSLASYMTAMARAEALDGDDREQVLVSAGLRAPAEPKPDARLVGVANWHLAVKETDEKRIALRKTIDNPLEKNDVRAAAREELRGLRTPPPPPRPLPVHD